MREMGKILGIVTSGKVKRDERREEEQAVKRGTNGGRKEQAL